MCLQGCLCLCIEGVPADARLQEHKLLDASVNPHLEQDKPHVTLNFACIMYMQCPIPLPHTYAALSPAKMRWVGHKDEDYLVLKAPPDLQDMLSQLVQIPSGQCTAIGTEDHYH